jgi:hypothetical protein
MDDTKIKEYIHAQRSAGLTDETIINQLLQTGWPIEQLNAYFPTVPIPPTSIPKNDGQRKKYHNPIFIGLLTIIVVCLLIASALLYTMNKKSKPQTFATLTQTNFSDITFKKPADWLLQISDDKTTQTYTYPANSAHGQASITITAGYDAIGEGFPSFPSSLQQSLLEKIRQGASLQNFTKSTPFKDCANPVFGSFQDITYTDTFLALKATETCTLDHHEKTIVALLVVPKKNGITAAIVAGADKADFSFNQVEMDNIVSSIRAK